MKLRVVRSLLANNAGFPKKESLSLPRANRAPPNAHIVCVVLLAVRERETRRNMTVIVTKRFTKSLLRQHIKKFYAMLSPTKLV